MQDVAARRERAWIAPSSHWHTSWLEDRAALASFGWVPATAETPPGAPGAVRRPGRLPYFETGVRHGTSMYVTENQHPTVRAPLSYSDLEHSDYDTVFLVAELSDAIRRGVSYFALSGQPLDTLNDVLNALVTDGEVAFDDDLADAPVAH